MHKHALLIIVLSLISFQTNIFCQDALLSNLDKELLKINEALKAQENPPYFIDFRVNDIKSLIIQYSSGSLVKNNQSHNRIMICSMRIGDYNKDNTDGKSSRMGLMSYGTNPSFELPVEDDSMAMNQIIRRELDLAYKRLQQGYKSNLSNKDEKEEKKDTIPSFSVEKPAQYYEPFIKDPINDSLVSNWKEKLKYVSKVFYNDTNIIMNELFLAVSNERVYYLNTEGTRIVQNRPQYKLFMLAVTSTAERNVVPIFKSYAAKEIGDLPTTEQLEADSKEMLVTLNQLRVAPLAEPYAGPCIFSSEAAGVVFHEIFGHRVEGQRLRDDLDGQTFLDKLGKKVLQDNLTIRFDPTVDEYHGLKLFGDYKYDDQGVKAQAVTVVDKGILKGFLMSRTPVKNFLNSNGHGRAQAGMMPFSRQSNLIIDFDKGETNEALRKMLIKECKKQKKSYGYYIKEVYGGYTNTMVFSPQVFNILPTVVYRVYTDGRPDELVRGVTFIGTPLTVFSEIIAHGNKCDVFNGFCGAESGSIPVSTISPPLLINKIETQKMPEDKVELPIIPRPN